MPYTLGQSLKQHLSDIRAICVLSPDEFVTSSRDTTSIIWERKWTKFEPKRTLLGHNHYISACCKLPPSDNHQGGLILTGGHDNTINAYDRCRDDPIKYFKGHTNAVSALAGLSSDTFLSGSWDSTIKLWLVNNATCISTINRHSASVFSLLLLNCGVNIVSASADKMIYVYTWPGLEMKKELIGHTDCVRALAPLKNSNFLSCSNDGTIRRWDAETGFLLDILFTYDNFFYSIAVTEDESLIVGSGENNNVVIIDGKGDTEIMKLPAITVWAVNILPNRDIITGSSDGVVRIFTLDPARQASASELIEYENKVKASQNPQSALTNLDDKTNISDLCGPEALLTPGTKDEQLLLVREDAGVMCYQWSETLRKWNLVGNVTGTNGNPNSLIPATPTQNRVMFEGEEYDFIFNIDVQDGCEPLKLPYRIGSNPYEVTDQFLAKHNLPQIYRGDVVNFIIKNTGSATCGSSSSEPQNNGFDHQNKETVARLSFPLEKFVIFIRSDLTKAKGKLLEFAAKFQGISSDVRWIDGLTEIASGDVIPTPQTLEGIKNCLEWPQENLFPVLDLIRLAVTHAGPNSRLCCKTGAFNNYLNSSFCNTTSIVNIMLVFKICANMVLHKEGQELAFEYEDRILDMAKRWMYKNDRSNSLEVGVSTFILNMNLLHLQRDNETSLTKLLDLSFKILEDIKDKEGILRILIGIGTACSRLERVPIPDSCFEFLQFIASDTYKEDTRQISDTAKQILKVVSNKFVILGRIA